MEGSSRNIVRRNVIAGSDAAVILYDSVSLNRFESNSFVSNRTPLLLVGTRTDTVFTGNYYTSNFEPDLDGDGKSDRRLHSLECVRPLPRQCDRGGSARRHARRRGPRPGGTDVPGAPPDLRGRSESAGRERRSFPRCPWPGASEAPRASRAACSPPACSSWPSPAFISASAREACSDRVPWFRKDLRLAPGGGRARPEGRSG